MVFVSKMDGFKIFCCLQHCKENKMLDLLKCLQVQENWQHEILYSNYFTILSDITLWRSRKSHNLLYFIGSLGDFSRTIHLSKSFNKSCIRITPS